MYNKYFKIGGKIYCPPCGSKAINIKKELVNARANRKAMKKYGMSEEIKIERKDEE